MSCEARAAEGENLDSPIWYRNGDLLTNRSFPDAARYSFNEKLTKLFIKNLVKKEDMACFQCLVKNSEGQLFMRGYLRVVDAIQVSQSPSKMIIVSDPDTHIYDITVRATGDNCCVLSYLYKFNDVQLSKETLNKPPFRQTNESTAVISFEPGSVSKEELRRWFGGYVCNVSDLYQYKLVYFTIREPENTSSAVRLWWILVIFGILIMILIPLVIFIIYKFRNRGETYRLEKTELKHNLEPRKELQNYNFKEI